MEIRTPIVAILILSLLLVIYLKRNMPRLLSARVFFAFVIMAYINIISEIVECAVFLYLEDSFSVLKRTTQNFYAATLLLCAATIAIYVYSKISSKRSSLIRNIVLITIPAVIGILVLITGKVFYGRTENGNYYSFGPGINICYLIGLLYIAATFIITFFYRGRMRKGEANTILVGLLMWAFLAFLQYSIRGLQVSSIAMMLMTLILFISMENPNEYYEKEIDNVRNRDAFVMMLAEKYGYKRTFFIVSVIFSGKTNVLTVINRQELYRMQEEIAGLAESEINKSAYLSNWNTLSFLIDSPGKVEKFMSIINNYKDDGGNYRLTFAVLEAPKIAGRADEALQILSYISGEYVLTQSSPNLVIDENIVDRMIYRNNIEEIVREAIKEKAFDVYYQPILSVRDGSFSAVEALVRLKRPGNEKFISPEEFIPIAEKCGLILDIDDLVFEKVCSFISREKLTEYGVKTVEVNLSGNEVVDRQTYHRLISKMEKYNIPPKLINFEITETSYINNDAVFKENVQKLKDMGSSFSMDDFGSGYSNLLELLKMDYMLVKMDKEFVWNCLDKNKPENMKMLEYTIGFLKEYGLHILAEGVETLEQARILIDKGVEYLQGFYYSRPISENDYIEFLKAQREKLKGDLS